MKTTLPHVPLRWRQLKILPIILLSLLLTSCGSSPDIGVALNPPAIVEMVGDVHTEYRIVRTEAIDQNNCGGKAETSNTVARARTVERSFEWGSEVTVDAGGQLMLFGTGVDVGTSVAAHLGYTYGSAESLERSLEVKSPPGAHMVHQVNQREVWDVGQVQLEVQGHSQLVPFSFRRDFDLHLESSFDLGCDGVARPLPTRIPTPTSVMSTETRVPPTVEPILPTETPVPLPTATNTLQPTATPTDAHKPPQNPNAGDGWIEPASGLEFVFVPAGEFTMGSSDEKPQHKVSTTAYWIGKTEVTNAQFRQFFADGGYANQSLWTTAGWQWRSDNAVTQPNCWDKTDFNGDNQPVVCISWYEVVAYTNWLKLKTGLEVRLPTEAEWEKAARGPDGNIYPWGNEWNASLLNASGKEDGYEYTAPVGSFPGGKSFYNALDMAGNVWEWNSTLYKAYPYNVDDGRENGDAEGGRLVRGGAWDRSPYFGRGALRSWSGPDTRSDLVGFRVVMASPGS